MLDAIAARLWLPVLFAATYKYLRRQWLWEARLLVAITTCKSALGELSMTCLHVADSFANLMPFDTGVDRPRPCRFESLQPRYHELHGPRPPESLTLPDMIHVGGHVVQSRLDRRLLRNNGDSAVCAAGTKCAECEYESTPPYCLSLTLCVKTDMADAWEH